MFPAQSAQRSIGARAICVRIILGLALYVYATNAVGQVQRGEGAELKWDVLHGCRLVTNSVLDGDSFHVAYKGREYIFRLYFVDSPETDPALKDRIKDQATYFGISTNDIPRAGNLASRFTREKLTGQEITVITRWQNAMGRSSLARFYCVVLVNGNNLAEELVLGGYARIYGPRANWPDGSSSTTFINKLKNLELTAREQKRGVWNQKAFPLDTDEVKPVVGSNKVKVGSASAKALDINSATFEELQTLPGIGPKLAERIIAHRPYQKLEDLERVPGIGSATVKRLESLIRAGSAVPGNGN